MGERLRLAEVVAVLGMATDLGLGLPMGVRQFGRVC